VALPTCAIFIPAYNAERTLEAVIERIPEEIWEAACAVLVINDGSADDTSAVVRRIAERRPKVVLHEQAVNQGYGAAVRRGLRLALETPAECVVCLHADGQYPPEKLPEMLAAMKALGADVLQGSRHKLGTARAGGMPLYKVVAGKVLTWMENKTFGLALTDYHSGYMLYSRRAAAEIPFERLSHYFDFDLEVIACARARGLAVDEIGIQARYGEEESHLNPILYGLRCLRVMLRYRLGRYRP
jgi:glycosyltransferase involved in cell wall biosynthesis